MRHVTGILVVLLTLAVSAAQAEWKEIRQIEAKDDVVSLDISPKGDRVAFACNNHKGFVGWKERLSGYLYSIEKKVTYDLKPPVDSRNSTYTGYVANVVFVDGQLLTHGGFQKCLWSTTGKSGKVVVQQILHEVSDPFVTMTKKAGKDNGILFYRPYELQEGEKRPVNSMLRSFVYVVTVDGLKDSFCHRSELEALALSADGQYAFTAGGNFLDRWSMKKTVSVKNQSAQRLRGEVYWPKKDKVTDMAASDNGSVAAMAMQDGSVVYALFDPSNKVDLETLPVNVSNLPSSEIVMANHALAMPADGLSVYVSRTRIQGESAVQEIVRVAPHQEPVPIFSQAGSEIIKLALVDDDRSLVCLDRLGVLRFFDITSGGGREIQVPIDTKFPATHMTFSRDGHTVAVWGDKQKAIVLCRQTKVLEKTVAGKQ